MYALEIPTSKKWLVMKGFDVLSLPYVDEIAGGGSAVDQIPGMHQMPMTELE